MTCVEPLTARGHLLLGRSTLSQMDRNKLNALVSSRLRFPPEAIFILNRDLMFVLETFGFLLSSSI